MIKPADLRLGLENRRVSHQRRGIRRAPPTNPNTRNTSTSSVEPTSAPTTANPIGAPSTQRRWRRRYTWAVIGEPAWRNRNSSVAVSATRSTWFVQRNALLASGPSTRRAASPATIGWGSESTFTPSRARATSVYGAIRRAGARRGWIRCHATAPTAAAAHNAASSTLIDPSPPPPPPVRTWALGR